MRHEPVAARDRIERLMASGMTLEDIANRAGISYHTISRIRNLSNTSILTRVQSAILSVHATPPPVAAVPNENEWIGDAACRTSDLGPDAWHPSPTNPQAVAAAVAVCRACPVAAQCLDAAIARREMQGVWGGLSQDQLHDLYAQQEAS